MQRFKKHVLDKYGIANRRQKMPVQIPITADVYTARFAYEYAVGDAAHHRIQQLDAIEQISRRGESQAWLRVVIGGHADGARACGFYLPGGRR